MSQETKIGFLIYPQVTQLDCTAPAQVLSRVPSVHVDLVWKDTSPVMTDAGFALLPTTSYADAPQYDVVCVPGGPGQADVMDDDEVLSFLRSQGEKAKYVTSVCTGSLLLAKAGLLEGYDAGCHWVWLEDLEKFGANPVDSRVVVDRNRITGGGVTAGLDFAFTLAAELAGKPVAQMLELAFEYDPAPPFGTGRPEKAGKFLADQVKANLRNMWTP